MRSRLAVQRSSAWSARSLATVRVIAKRSVSTLSSAATANSSATTRATVQSPVLLRALSAASVMRVSSTQYSPLPNWF